MERVEVDVEHGDEFTGWSAAVVWRHMVFGSGFEMVSRVWVVLVAWCDLRVGQRPGSIVEGMDISQHGWAGVRQHVVVFGCSGLAWRTGCTCLGGAVPWAVVALAVWLRPGSVYEWHGSAGEWLW